MPTEILPHYREDSRLNSLSRLAKSVLAQSSQFWTVTAIVVFIGALLIQILLAFPVHESRTGADSVLGGICGLNVLHGSHPLMFPGIDRFGALQCYVNAGAFSLFGVSRESLQFVLILYFVLFLVFIYLYLREAFGPRASVAGLLLAAVPPVQFLLFYGDILALCAGALWLATLLEHRTPRMGWFFAFGALLGVALWCSMLSLTITLPLVLWLLFRRVLNSPSRIGITFAAAVAGSSPMWIFLLQGGISKWGADPHLHATHTATQLFSNALYLAFTLVPWFFTNHQPYGQWLLSLSGLIMLLYAAAAVLLLGFAFWPNSKLRRQPVLLRQAVLFGLIVVVFAGLFVLSSAGSLRGWNTRYISPLYLIIPGMASLVCATLERRALLVAGASIALLLILNGSEYEFPSSPVRKQEQANLDAEKQLVYRLDNDRVQAVVGGYWDVYSLNFDSRETILGIPIASANDYFSFGSNLDRRTLKWALIENTLGQVYEWQRRLNFTGRVFSTPDGRYVAVAGAGPSLGAENFLRAARSSSPLLPPRLTSFSQQITSPVHKLEMKRGQTYTINIKVRNTGTQPWIRDGAQNCVNASYRWLSNGKILPIDSDRTHLGRPEILSGGSDALRLQVAAPPRPGVYTLWISMVQEGVNWFYEQGAKPLVLKVTVK